jgi:hypothetical protein
MEVASSSEIPVTIYQPIQKYASEDCHLNQQQAYVYKGEKRKRGGKKIEKRVGTIQELRAECNLSLLTVL